MQVVFGAGHNQHVGVSQLTDTAIRLEQGLNRLNHRIGGYIDQRCHLHDARRRSIAKRLRRGNVGGQVGHHQSRIPQLAGLFQNHPGVAAQQPDQGPDVIPLQRAIGRGSDTDLAVDAGVNHQGNIQRIGQLLQHQTQLGLLIIQFHHIVTVGHFRSGHRLTKAVEIVSLTIAIDGVNQRLLLGGAGGFQHGNDRCRLTGWLHPGRADGAGGGRWIAWFQRRAGHQRQCHREPQKGSR